eukprot:scpid89303/ scgid0452/ 
MSRATSRQLRKTFSNLRFKARVVVAQLPELFVPGERKVLNLGEIDQDDSEELSNCLALVSQLTKYMQWMKAEFMSDNGHCVDYRSLKDSTLFGQYTRACRRLREADLSELTDAERKAFFLSKISLSVVCVCQFVRVRFEDCTQKQYARQATNNHPPFL